MLLVETFEGTDIIEVPLASNPEIAHGQSYDVRHGYSIPGETHFGFSCFALYDIDKNYSFAKMQQHGTDMDTTILRMARDILQKRAAEDGKTWNQRVADGEI
jgi:hypothetical protein